MAGSVYKYMKYFCNYEALRCEQYPPGGVPGPADRSVRSMKFGKFTGSDRNHNGNYTLS